MNSVLCFYCDDGYAAHLKIALDSLRRHDPDIPVLVLLVSDKKPNWLEAYQANTKLISRDKLIAGNINSLKSLLFDLTDFDLIVHYDCDVIFHRSVGHLLKEPIKGLRMSPANSSTPHKRQTPERVAEKFRLMENLYRKHIGPIEDFSNYSGTIYNDGFFVASRELHYDLFKEWQIMMGLDSPLHKRGPVDQFLINYLGQTKHLIEPMPISYNYNYTLPLTDDVFAVHYVIAREQQILDYKNRKLL